MLAMLSAVTAVVSAFLDNVTTVLLIAPVTLAVTQQLETPVPRAYCASGRLRARSPTDPMSSLDKRPNRLPIAGG
jgi:Na+/H+ antiporter NhaD/arsenite permease-like protein